jgi:hypothetical protein
LQKEVDEEDSEELFIPAEYFFYYQTAPAGKKKKRYSSAGRTFPQIYSAKTECGYQESREFMENLVNHEWKEISASSKNIIEEPLSPPISNKTNLLNLPMDFSQHRRKVSFFGIRTFQYGKIIVRVKWLLQSC